MDHGPGGRRSFRERLAEQEHAVFVGRESELAVLDGLLQGRDDRGVVFVHGPGGIGKTRLLAAFRERAGRLGWSTAAHRATILSESDTAGADLIRWAAEADRALVSIDGWDDANAATLTIRDDVLAHLPETTVVVVACRARPDLEWWGAWGRLIVDLPLGPLARREAMQLLAAHGVEHAERAAEVEAWASGSPLALTMAAGAGPDWRPQDDGAAGPIITRLSRRLIGGTVPDQRLGALAVAATARVTTPDVLAAAIPGIDAAEAFHWLESQTYVESWAGGLALHGLVRGVVRAEVRLRAPDVVRDVRRRLADHYWARAVRAGTPYVPDLLHLIEDDDVRWGVGWTEDGSYQMDRVRAGDLDRLAPLWAAAEEQWHWVCRYIAEAPDSVGVVRDRRALPRGLMITVTPRSAPGLAAEDPILGPWLQHARANVPDGNCVLWRTANDFTQDPKRRVQALIGATGIRRSGLANPRWVYLPINPMAERAVAFATAIGAVHDPALDVELSGELLQCRIADLGPGGVLGAYRAVIYAELGIPAPHATAVPSEVVRDAFRSWDDPQALAASPLAQGTTVLERAASVRSQLQTALDLAFTRDNQDDTFLRRVLEEGYILHESSHESTARRLGLSRAAYFRRLREATERVAACLPTVT